MLDAALFIKLAVAAMALVWIGRILVMRSRTVLHVCWAVFCGGLTAVMIREVTGDSTGAFAPALAIASCGTCSVFWLVARALFRPVAPIGWPQLLLVGGIFAPAVILQTLQLTGLSGAMPAPALAQLSEGLGGFQTLLSSTVLVLSFWEGVRGWTPALPANEKRLRGLFLATFGLCVSTCVMLLDHGDANLPADLMAAIQASCALAILLVISVAVRYRELHPLPVEADSRPAPAAGPDDIALGHRIRSLMEAEQPFLDPGFKVADLARRLQEPEYRVSRAITAGLKASNFNRFVNAYRIETACRMLVDPALRREPVLNIALDAGFASLGPFNRAFKDRTGQTPREFRRAALTESPPRQALSIAAE